LPVRKRSKSVLKNARQSERRRVRNRGRKARLKDILKQARTAKTKAAGAELLPKLQAIVDKSARKGLIHRNTAARIKSSVTRQFSKLA
jgi:small subunit ribosomal protein S20